MNYQELKKNAVKIAEIDMKDPLYHMYAGTMEWWDLDGFVYVHTKPTNATVYMGETRTSPVGDFDKFLQCERDRVATLTVPYTDLLDQLEAYAEKKKEKK